MKPRSIARRLIASVLLIQFISALAVIGTTLAYERHTQFRAFDVMLRGRADSLLGAVQDADDESDEVMLDQRSLQVPAEDVYEVVGQDGRVLGRSANWGVAQAEAAQVTGDGIFRAKLGDVGYRLIRLHGVRVVDPGKADGGTVRAVSVVYGSPTGTVSRQIRAAVIFYAVASAFLLMLTGALVAWLLHLGMSPLRELAAEAEGLSAERWEFHSPEGARSTRELAPLATALQSAVRRLEQSFEQQRHFVSDAAHELKTAVAVIKSSLQLLTMRHRSQEEYATGLDRSLGDCERLEEIVAKMLMLAQLESRPGGDGAIQRTDLAACAADAIEQLRPVAELRGVEARMESIELAQVGLSKAEGTLLCSNLLMNAVQHSAKGGHVHLRICSLEGDRVELRVEDQGEGMDPATLAHVFERFYRGDSSRARKTGGTGLGLAICRAMVQRAGGAIELESTRDVGTVAIVRLPGIELDGGNSAQRRVAAGVSSA